MNLRSPEVRRFSPRFTLLAAGLALALAGCGGGESGSGNNNNTGGTSTASITGGGVKGPLANAVVTVYRLDTAQPGFKGGVVATASTDAGAAITGLSLPLPLNRPYIMEFTSTPGTTTDITTNSFPVIATLRTVITQQILDAGTQIYATPLTTMAVDLAINNADSTTAPFAGDGNGSTSSAEFLAALPVAATQVTSTLGFGIDTSVDIFNTPPLIDSTTDTVTKQSSVAHYRAAVEALTAVVYTMNQQVAGTSTDKLMTELVADLGDGGGINGSAGGVINNILLQVLQQDPKTLVIPNTTQRVADVGSILASETASTGATVSTASLTDGTINVQPVPAETNPDLDGDGVANMKDAFPLNAAETADADGDGLGDNTDIDDDNDGFPDTIDAFPLDAAEHLDSDGDSVGDNADTDDDNDGVLDSQDAFPLDPARSSISDADGDGWPASEDPNDQDATNPGTPFIDTDGDGVGDSIDLDDDNDGVADTHDAFPLDASESRDGDGDGIGDNADHDDDNDHVVDSQDAFPFDATESVDTDGDGIGNNADTDDDNDGLSDTAEIAAGTNPLLKDTDGDGRFDAADAFPLDPAESVDTDGDGIGNNADTDDDGDGVPDTVEIKNGTKPLLADTDGDGVNDNADVFPLDATESVDTDGDGIGNNADTDDDNDGIPDTVEITNGTNPLLADTDGDGVNDGVDVFPLDPTETQDTDGDGVGDAIDNCVSVANPDQTDSNSNGIGDACDNSTSTLNWDDSTTTWDNANWGQ